jgi:hypothetical protein
VPFREEAIQGTFLSMKVLKRALKRALKKVLKKALKKDLKKDPKKDPKSFDSFPFTSPFSFD